MKILSASLFLFPTLSLALSPPAERSRFGMVAADSQLASEAGAQLLQAGGDAVDAAVATALMLGVVHPFASGLGGGGFALIYRQRGEALALDFREQAPAAATANMYLDAEGAPIPKASIRGPQAAAVPAELAGLWSLHKRFGKRPWSEVVAPALKAARDGFPASPTLHKRVKRHLKAIKARPALARDLLKRGAAPQVGEWIRRQDLATTLSLISKEGASTFYEGSLGLALVEAIQRDKGLINVADLKAYQVKERPLIRGAFRGYEILSMPPPSSGGAVLLQTLRALEGSNLKAMGHNSSAYLHRLAEALKHGFADRARIMGDPDFTPVPVEALIGDETRDRLRAHFKYQETGPQEAYGGAYALPNDQGTTHFSVVDAAGNAVALTTTVNTAWGSMYVAGSTGILLNNQMDDFVMRPGVPNSYGLIGQASNAIAPGKRPLSSMSPTLVLKGDQLLLALGASGGATIITGTLQVLLNVLIFGMDPQAAVEAPRIHHQWVPEFLHLEPEIPMDVREALRRRGHRLKIKRRYNAVQLIQNGEEGQAGACDPSKLGRPAAPPRIKKKQRQEEW